LDKKVKNFNEFDVSSKVRERGWVLSAYAMPPDAQEVISLRVVVRPHLNHTMINQLSNDIINACKYLEKNGGTAKPPQLHGPERTAPKC
jgi:glutamate decarboxylase